MSEPAAEYMSKIGSEEGKNEGGSQLGALAFPNPLRASTRSQRNDVGSGGQNGGDVDGSAGGNNHVVVFAGPKKTEKGGRLPPVAPSQVTPEREDGFRLFPSRRDGRDFHLLLV